MKGGAGFPVPGWATTTCQLRFHLCITTAVFWSHEGWGRIPGFRLGVHRVSTSCSSLYYNNRFLVA